MTVKAAVLKNYGEALTVEDVRLKEPGEGEVKVKMQAAGICHSDYHVIHADLPLPVPIVLGHEGAGIVQAVGKGVRHVQPGDHVVLNWVPACRECYFCRNNRPDLCDSAQRAAVMGTLSDGTTRFFLNEKPLHHFSATGTFAEYTVVSAASVIPIERDIPFHCAALIGCSVLSGVGAVIHTAQVEPGSSVAVIGTGGVGLNIIQGARLVGAEKIIAVDIEKGKEQMARQFGATHFVHAANEDVVTKVVQLSGGLGVDYAFEAIGRPETIQQAYHCLRKGGTAVVVGLAPASAEVTINAFSLPQQAKTLTGCYYGQGQPERDIPKLLSLYRAGLLKLEPLISKTYRLDEINQGFQDMAEGRIARGIIEFD